MIWFTRELVKSSAQGADSVIHSLIRQVSGKYDVMLFLLSVRTNEYASWCVGVFAPQTSLLFIIIKFSDFAGGDVSPKNIWLAESVLDILSENR